MPQICTQQNLARIIIKLMDKEMNSFLMLRGAQKQLAYQFRNQCDPRTKDNNVFDAVFGEVDIYLANQLF